MNKKFIITLCLIIILCLVSCAGSAKPDVEGLSAAEYFQKANEATDNKNYSLAIKYYTAFQEHFPDDLERNLWAEYEIAFAYYKMGKNEKAVELFDQLIAEYDGANAEAFPVAPRALSEKVKAKIAE